MKKKEKRIKVIMSIKKKKLYISCKHIEQINKKKPTTKKEKTLQMRLKNRPT